MGGFADVEHGRGVTWKLPSLLPLLSLVFRLGHVGEVNTDGSSLFTAIDRATATKPRARNLKHRIVHRFVDVYSATHAPNRDTIGAAVRHLYALDLKVSWGVNVAHELKLLAPKSHCHDFDAVINDIVDLDIQRFVVHAASG
ncbi:uncharacterized protein LOC127780292 [Oryza glaberrima]|uniref:uncharacterized protein LOC127780292 n=1 Tax=Oryza glaberrima TaxID=4538 RepID=UPI00224C3E33|nr:uncharacterized protein LOC127780292 [Oryza glaberrima]